MTKKKTTKKSAAKRKTTKKTTRIEKLEFVASQLLIRVKTLEESLAALTKKCEGCCAPSSKPQPIGPYYAPNVFPWQPVWHNVWTPVDYAEICKNKAQFDNKYNKLGDYK